MGILLRSLSTVVVVFSVILVGCTEDPVPTYVSGNPNLELVRDSIVVVSQTGDSASIMRTYVTPAGDAYAAGLERTMSGTFNQGDIWKFNGSVWESDLDAAARDMVLSVTGLHGSRAGSVWAVAQLKDRLPTRGVAVLRKEGLAWIDVSPDTLESAFDCHVISDDDVWVYGQSNAMYHYRSGVWEKTMMPAPWDTLGQSGVTVESVAGDAGIAYALATVKATNDSTGRVLLVYKDGGWSTFYQEGTLPEANAQNRLLESLMFSNEGALHAIGDAVYRWDGSQLIRAFRAGSGAKLHDGAVSPSGSLLAVGDNMTAVWTNGASWHNVHLEYSGQSAFLSVGMNDSLVVIGAIDGTVHELLRGILRRVDQ